MRLANDTSHNNDTVSSTSEEAANTNASVVIKTISLPSLNGLQHSSMFQLQSLVSHRALTVSLYTKYCNTGEGGLELLTIIVC